MVFVQLTPSQIFQGAMVGVMRQCHVIQAGRNHTRGETTKNDWQRHVDGALAELAVAQYLDLFWDGKVGLITAGDVGSIEVRTTHHVSGRLIVHDDDPDDARFVLVTGCNGTYDLRGWIAGMDGKRDEYRDDPKGGRPAYFVPQDRLRPMTELTKAVVASP